LAQASQPAVQQDGSGSAVDSTATLEWTASTDTRVRGYRVYFGTASRAYRQRKGEGIDVGKVTTYQVRNLQPSATYYFAVTAYDAAGNESDYSAEASKVFP
jgi:hypothetical protein